MCAENLMGKMKNGHSQKVCKCPFLKLIVLGRDGIEPPTRGFSFPVSRKYPL